MEQARAEAVKLEIDRIEAERAMAQQQRELEEQRQQLLETERQRVELARAEGAEAMKREMKATVTSEIGALQLQSQVLQNTLQDEAETEAVPSESDYESTRRMMVLRGTNESYPIASAATATKGINDWNIDLHQAQQQQVQRTDDAFVVSELVSWGANESTEIDDEPYTSLPSSSTTISPPDSALGNIYPTANNPRRIRREIAVVLPDNANITTTTDSSNHSVNSQVQIQPRLWSDASPTDRMTDQSFDAPLDDVDDDYLMKLRTEEFLLWEKSEGKKSI